MSKHPLSREELGNLIGSQDIGPFLNPRNEMYRERGMKADPPSRDEAVRLMAENPNLIRRPLLVKDDGILFGFDEAAYRGLASSKSHWSREKAVSEAAVETRPLTFEDVSRLDREQHPGELDAGRMDPSDPRERPGMEDWRPE